MILLNLIAHGDLRWIALSEFSLCAFLTASNPLKQVLPLSFLSPHPTHTLLFILFSLIHSKCPNHIKTFCCTLSLIFSLAQTSSFLTSFLLVTTHVLCRHLISIALSLFMCLLFPHTSSFCSRHHLGTTTLPNNYSATKWMPMWSCVCVQFGVHPHKARVCVCTPKSCIVYKCI